MTEELKKLYFKCRKSKPFMMTGRDAECSLRSAKTILEFRELERKGLVRIRVEEEEESYYDVFGKPEPYKRRGHMISAKEAKKEMDDILSRHGVWWTAGEYFNGKEWILCDACGMHTGYKNPADPFENCYIIQEMQSAIDGLDKFWSEQPGGEHDDVTKEDLENALLV